MKTDIDGLECGSEAARLLPWFVAGRLEPADRTRVEEHLAACAICRADHDAQAELRELMRSDDRIEYAPQPALQKLMSRIDEMDRDFDSAGVPEWPVSSPVATRAPRWLIAALVLQTVGLGLLGAAVWRHSSLESTSAQYRTLSSVPAPLNDSARLRMVFAPATTVGEVAELLRPMHGTLVSGPSEAGAYAVAVRDDAAQPANLAQQIARLRADRRVLFVEPIAGTAPTLR